MRVTVFLLILAGLLWARALYGNGSYDEYIGAYQICLPLGWSITNKVEAENHTSFQTQQWACPGILLGQIMTLKDGEKFLRAFPDIDPTYHPDINPVTRLIIDGIPFEKVSWSIKNAKVYPSPLRGTIPPWLDTMWGFDILSLGSKEIIHFRGWSFSQREFVAQENIVMTLKHRKK
jgi:hypothetical protein